jgi:hypothetical protein
MRTYSTLYNSFDDTYYIIYRDDSLYYQKYEWRVYGQQARGEDAVLLAVALNAKETA